ncbi:TIGR03826 family flagellar region protein [Paenibacillus protaetiae]|uniref:Flagellar protein n=1 Tax=Paenibacillus protaetiae TaxID=2509456 RepID=A0A4P6EZN6_9BACL|nr:TIGR03826 family flagellar region protein [Paenibacillus protaetiae]QAY68574.1 flagellar protein [Paenibacillus protaetiae]
MNLENCPRCGRLFAKNFRDVCPNCIREIDKQYETCANYLRENRGATIVELSEAVDVSIRQITKFIREGRISLMNAPNLSYPCEVCGTLIRESHICDNCRKRLEKDINSLHKQQSEAGRSHQESIHAYRIKEDK